LNVVIQKVKEARKNKESVHIGYLGNIVDLWEKFA
jgi:urocanate hydratase